MVSRESQSPPYRLTQPSMLMTYVSSAAFSIAIQSMAPVNASVTGVSNGERPIMPGQPMP